MPSHQAAHEVGEPVGEPLILDTVPDAVTPSRIRARARQRSPIQGSPRLPAAVLDVRLWSEGGGHVRRVQGWMHDDSSTSSRRCGPSPSPAVLSSVDADLSASRRSASPVAPFRWSAHRAMRLSRTKPEAMWIVGHIPPISAKR